MPKSQAESNMDDPQEMFSWMFAAGVPDARGDKYQNQPMIPGPNMPAFSQMLYDLGCRFHPDLQTKWVKQGNGPDRNFIAWGTTDIKPDDVMGDVAEMLAEIDPAKAAVIAKVTPESHQDALKEAAKKMMDSIERLKLARDKMAGPAAGVEGGDAA